MNTDTLFCQSGQHEWQREKKRGRKPASCPEHQSEISKSTMSVEEAARRRQEGRTKAKAERDKDGIARVLAYKQWVREDTEITIQRNIAYAEGGSMPPRPRMPRIPTQADYAAAISAGVHRGIVVEEDAA